MFFMMGITDGRKDFDFHQQIICDICGKYGRFQVFMTYTVLSLFFIPCFKWNKHYYVQTSCCNTVYELDAQVGKRIAAGEDVEILPQHLRRMNQFQKKSATPIILKIPKIPFTIHPIILNAIIIGKNIR